MNTSFIKDFAGAHLLVAGEVGIDEYLWGDTHRISPEAPVPVVEVDHSEHKLGLAANVAQNIVSLGGKVSLVSVRGKDNDGTNLENLLIKAGVRSTTLLTDESRPTLRKVRVIAQRQHVVRIDHERVHPLEAKLAKKFNEAICDQLQKADGVIVQDYGKGLWNSDTMAFVKQAREKKKPVFVDPNRNTPAALYKNTTLLTPNTAEAEILSGLTPNPRPRETARSDERLAAIGRRILSETEAEHVVITCGEAGMVSLTRGESGVKRIPTFARDVFDVTGAGDTVVSVLALMMVLGHPLALCMQVANAAAGIVVARIGASSVSPQELREELERLQTSGTLA